MEQVGRAVQSRIFRAGVFGRTPTTPVAPEQLERAAERALSAPAWAYLAGSAGAERTAAANRAAFDRHQIVPRMLTGTTARDLSVTLFGRRYPTPLLLSPVGVLDLAAPSGDLGAARASARTGVPMVVSTQACASTEQIAAAQDAVTQAATHQAVTPAGSTQGSASQEGSPVGGGPRWYQLYWSSVPELAQSMVQRAERAGCQVLVVTLDTPMLGWRPRDLDLGFLPFARGQGIAQYTGDPVFMDLVRQRVAAGTDEAPSGRPTPAAVRSLVSLARTFPGELRANLRSPLPRAAVQTFLDVFPNPALTWADLSRLREWTSLPIVLKGIVAADDARRALDAGVDGVWVSNHGGRQIDGALGALDALPAVAAAVGDAAPVVFDSGVRTGADVAIALALGASAVGIGRPYAYGLAIDGEDGAVAVLDHLLAELDLTMGLAGVAAVADLGPDLLTPSP